MVKEFVYLNKANSFDSLSDLFIEPRNSAYDTEVKTYQLFVYTVDIYDSLSGTSIRLPVFGKNATEEQKRESFHDCSDDCKKVLRNKYREIDDQMLFQAYVRFVNAILKLYNDIHLPKDYPYSNVLRVKGSHKRSIISFKLTNEVEVIYFAKIDSINPAELTGLAKFDEHWYYRVRSGVDQPE